MESHSDQPFLIYIFYCKKKKTWDVKILDFLFRNFNFRTFSDTLQKFYCAVTCFQPVSSLTRFRLITKLRDLVLLSSFSNTVVLIFQTLKNFGWLYFWTLKVVGNFLFVMYYHQQIDQSLLVNFRVFFNSKLKKQHGAVSSVSRYQWYTVL